MQRRWMAAAFVVAALMGTAGCLDAGTGSGGSKSGAGASGVAAGTKPIILDGWSEEALIGGEGHDHRDPRQHKNLTTANFEIVGYNPLITDYYGRTAGGHFCSDTKEHEGRVLSVVHSWVSDVAFVISDVTDPAKPQKIGELAMDNTHVYDLTLTPDQQFILLATSPNGIGPNDPTAAAKPSITFRDACTGQVSPVDGPEAGLPYSSGIVLVDISNPRVPAVVDFTPFPVNGGHSVQADIMDGQLLVLVSVPNPGPGLSYYVFARIDATPTGAKLVPMSYYQYTAAGAAPTGLPTNLHDGFLQKHPVTGKNLAYLAYGVTGLVIVDITDPADPQFVSHWADYAKAPMHQSNTHFMHEALPMTELWDGRHYTFIGEECGSQPQNVPTCLAYVLDTTDPAKPAFVGAWTLPHAPQWAGGLQYSLHYLGVQNRTLFVSNYHGGLWAVDVSTDEARATMPSIGVFMPDRVSPKPIGGTVAFDYTPVVLDVNVLSDGTLVVYDGTSGLYTVRFDATNPAPAPAPWPVTEAPSS